MSYYNTTNVTGPLLKKYQQKTVNQNIEIMEFFNQNPKAQVTRAELHEHVLQDAPVSSITRSLSNLKDEGRLIKTKRRMKVGKYGRYMHSWRLP